MASENCASGTPRLNALRSFLGFGAAEDEDTTYNDKSARERAEERLERWHDESTTLFYCELCEQVFVSFDIFYNHRDASESERARETDERHTEQLGVDFAHYRKLTSGDELPEDATVGKIEPCDPVEERDDDE